MKRLTVLLCCLALAVFLAACGSPATMEENVPSTALSGTSPGSSKSAGLPEGYEQVEGPGEIEAQLDLFITLPEKAEAATYGIVDGRYAYMTFTFDGVAYSYSVGRGKANVHEDGGTYVHQEAANWLDYPYELAWNDDGAGCAQWEDELTGACHRLTARSGANRELLSEVAVMLLPAA